MTSCVSARQEQRLAIQAGKPHGRRSLWKRHLGLLPCLPEVATPLAEIIVVVNKTSEIGEGVSHDCSFLSNILFTVQYRTVILPISPCFTYRRIA
jgi:hypothetical protein